MRTMPFARLALPLFLCASLAAPALAESGKNVVLRVGVLTKYPLERLQVLNTKGPFRIAAEGAEYVYASGKTVDLVPVGNQISVRFRGHETLRKAVLKLTDASLDTPGLPWRRFPGELLVRAKNGKLSLVNEVPLESYVASVVASETEPTWPLEALKCQAVIARSFALAENRHRHENYDLCDQTDCQVYHGLDSRNPAAGKAVRETHGQVLSFHDRPALTLYHSTCGGSIAPNEAIFGGAALPYLKGGSDKEKGNILCRESPSFSTWRVSLSLEELAKALDAPNLTGLALERTSSGFVRKVTLEGRQTRAIGGYPFWLALGSTFGWGEVKSLNFSVKQEKEHLVFSGKGMGHGVGLCQWGARKLALMGVSYRKILNRYYPGTILVPVSRIEAGR